jgi:catechol 2,3-dioxygenase-like lactoylglutathione lyase family enzyme
MADEVTIPILPCGDLDEAIAFYEALGFERTYRQTRPNPYAVVAREDINIHLFGLDDFDPAASTGNVIVAVPDPDELYASFAAGLRAAFGKLPSTGIPRILRPRKKFGTVRGFSVVDPGDNWLRVSKRGDTEDEANRHKSTGLARVIDNAARQGDARGDDRAAMTLLDNGLARFADAPAIDRVRTLLYRAELAVRLGDGGLATGSLAEAQAVELSDDESTAVAPDIAHAAEVVATVVATAD